MSNLLLSESVFAFISDIDTYICMHAFHLWLLYCPDLASAWSWATSTFVHKHKSLSNHLDQIDLLLLPISTLEILHLLFKTSVESTSVILKSTLVQTVLSCYVKIENFTWTYVNEHWYFNTSNWLPISDLLQNRICRLVVLVAVKLLRMQELDFTSGTVCPHAAGKKR